MDASGDETAADLNAANLDKWKLETFERFRVGTSTPIKDRFLVNRESVRIERTGIGREWEWHCRYSHQDVSFKFIVHGPETSRTEGNFNDGNVYVFILIADSEKDLIEKVKAGLKKIKENIASSLNFWPDSALLGFDASKEVRFTGPIS